MIASHVTLPTLVQAAQAIGVRLETHSLSTMRHQVKLLPETPQELYRGPCNRCRQRLATEHVYPPCRCRRIQGEQGDAKYQRVNTRGNNHRVNAVCWHGFRDYFRAVYQTTPKAKFYTALDTWKDAEDFERRFRESGHKNIGSLSCPMAAAEACRCPESGSVGHSNHLEAWARGTGEATWTEILPDPTHVVTIDMGVDDILVQPEGVSVERWADYNKKMNDLLMGRKE